MSDYYKQNGVDTNQPTQPIYKRTQAEKKMDRILANRRSARRSRERKKQLQQNLQLAVTVLSKRNEDLVQENIELKQQLQVLSGVAHQWTNQRQKSVASDRLLLQLLLRKMQPGTTGLNTAASHILYSQNKPLSSSSPASLI